MRVGTPGKLGNRKWTARKVIFHTVKFYYSSTVICESSCKSGINLFHGGTLIKHSTLKWTARKDAFLTEKTITGV